MTANPLDILAQAEAATERRNENGHGLEYTDPTTRVSAKTRREVTTSEAKRAGAFDRKTIYIAPELIEWVAATAAAEGIGVLAFYRFLLAAGREAFESGRARPEPASSVVHRLKSDEG